MTTKAFLFQNIVSKEYWGKTVLIATYIINRLLTSVTNFKSTLEIFQQFYLTVSVPNHMIFQIFGCIIFIHIHSHQREN